MTAPPPPPNGGYGNVSPPSPSPSPSPYDQLPVVPPVPAPAPPPVPGGWGQQPPVAPLPPRNTSGNKIAMGIGIVIGLFILLSGVREVYAGGSSDGDGSGSQSAVSTYNGPTYSLTVPKTVLDGRFTLKNGTADPPEDGGAARSTQNELAYYETESGDRQLIVWAMHTRDENPLYPKYEMLDASSNDPAVDVAVPRRKITPVKGDPLACEVQSKVDTGGDKVTVPVCSWIDPYTQGLVTDDSQSARSKKPSDVDLDAFAKEAAGVRDEMRVRAEG